ncbi:hypothetical protein KSC_018070 [Ktedonobacter sp. SOSP1-52]|nr:hypothetical protein KSC_018070 [Ktedonobacter sp. SOSP1-52]
MEEKTTETPLARKADTCLTVTKLRSQAQYRRKIYLDACDPQKVPRFQAFYRNEPFPIKTNVSMEHEKKKILTSVKRGWGAQTTACLARKAARTLSKWALKPVL